MRETIKTIALLWGVSAVSVGTIGHARGNETLAGIGAFMLSTWLAFVVGVAAGRWLGPPEP